MEEVLIYFPIANAVLIFETQLISIANNATASKTWYWIAVAVFVMLGFIFRARNKPVRMLKSLATTHCC